MPPLPHFSERPCAQLPTDLDPCLRRPIFGVSRSYVQNRTFYVAVNIASKSYRTDVKHCRLFITSLRPQMTYYCRSYNSQSAIILVLTSINASNTSVVIQLILRSSLMRRQTHKDALTLNDYEIRFFTN